MYNCNIKKIPCQKFFCLQYLYIEEMGDLEDLNIISDTDNNTPLTKKKRIINAPRSEKQIESFKKAQIKRDENRRIKKEEKDAKMAQIYMENKMKEEQKKTQQAAEKKKEVKQIIKYIDEESAEEEQEVIYMKKKPKKKPPKIVTYESSDEEPEPVKPQRQTSRVVRNEPKLNLQ